MKEKLIKNKNTILFYVAMSVFLFCFCVVPNNFSIDSFYMYYEGSRFPELSEYVCQQWIFNRLVYHLYNIISWERIQVFIMVLSSIIFISYIVKNDIDKVLNRICICALIIMYFFGALSVRPWVFSLSSIIGIYYVTDPRNKIDYKWQLLWTGVFSLVVANFEASFDAFVLCFIGVRLFDSVIEKKWRESTKYISLEVLAFICMFINPYGSRGALYLYDSLTNNTFNYISMDEMASITIKDPQVEFILISLVLLWFSRKYTTLGEKICIIVCTILTCIAIRNLIFLGCACIYPYTRYINEINLKISYKKGITYRNCFVLALVVFNFYGIANNIVKPDFGYPTYYTMIVNDNVLDYIKEHDNEEYFIYPNYGGYLEMNGVKGVNADTRPELYSEDYLKKFDGLTHRGDITSMVNTFGHDFVVLNYVQEEDSHTEKIINDYMKKRDDYSIVYQDDMYVIYHRIRE